MLRIVVLALVLLAPRLAAAHDLWLLPPDAPAKVGAPVEIRVTQGMDFPGDSPAPKVERFARVVVVGPDGKTVDVERKPPRGDAGILRFVPRRAGVHVVAVDTAPKSIELSADDFNHYLVADGMPQWFVARHEAGELDRNAVERYAKSVQLLVEVGDTPSAVPTVKQRLRIVPLVDPFSLGEHDVLRFRVLLDDKPLANARVGFDTARDGPEPSATARTNAEGEAAFAVLGPGLYTLRLTHLTRPKKKTYEWDSAWTTLTFRIPETRSFAEAVDRVTVVHGGPGPFAMAGYRIGLDALARLGHSRGTTKLEVRHHSPDTVQWSCVVDGVQAATGASPGKMNLTRSTAKDVYTEIVDRKSKRRLKYRLTDAFVKRFLDRPRSEAQAAAAEIAAMPGDAIFSVD
ncbi:MAG: DUF4198 domain-containing protein [Deltaproteobacteria bacterium]